jgi:hypothetical protein
MMTNIEKQHLDIPNYDFTPLVKRFLDLNQTGESVGKLNLDSSIENGYYIDYEDNFSRYGVEHGGYGFEVCRLFHPQATSYTTVSVPAYDPVTGYVIMYIGGTNIRYFGNGGDISIYQYVDGELTYVSGIKLWV